MGMASISQLKLLVVDDDLEDLRSFSAILQQNGHEVDAFCSCEEGAAHAAREPYDFVLVSQGGRDFEGQQVIKGAKELDADRPVLVIARCPEMACYLEAMQLGAADYVPKPLSAHELLKAMEPYVSFRAAA
jgi:DNA-binding response OmpR family regulator